MAKNQHTGRKSMIRMTWTVPNLLRHYPAARSDRPLGNSVDLPKCVDIVALPLSLRTGAVLTAEREVTMLKTLIGSVLAGTLGLFSAASAQNYPTRPITMVIPACLVFRHRGRVRQAGRASGFANV